MPEVPTCPSSNHRPAARYCVGIRYVLIISVVVGSCRPSTGGRGDTAEIRQGGHPMKLESSGFAQGATIPRQYTADGADRSPPLAWSDVPEGTKSFALICEDPDAPSPRRPAPTPWVHWVIYNIPADRTDLPEGVARHPEVPELGGARQGKNSWPSDNVGYRGPAPPPGSGTHRYFFRIYALDSLLNLPAGATKDELMRAMKGHILGQGECYGTYQR